MKPPRLYVVCPCCYRGDLPRTKNGKGLLERGEPRSPAFTRLSTGLGRGKGFEHVHEEAELPTDVREVLIDRAKAFLKAMGVKKL